MCIQVNIKSINKELPWQKFHIKKGKTVADVIKKYDLTYKPSFIILVDGKRKDEDYQLKDGDNLIIFPPVAGG